MNTPSRDTLYTYLVAIRCTTCQRQWDEYIRLIQYHWPLREPVSFPEYTEPVLPMGFNDESEFGLWYVLQDDI